MTWQADLPLHSWMPRHCTLPLLGSGGAGMLFVVSVAPGAFAPLEEAFGSPLLQAPTNNAATLMARHAPVLFCIPPEPRSRESGGQTQWVALGAAIGPVCLRKARHPC